VWTAEIGEIFRNGWGDGARGTPTVDGDRVYALGAEGNLICAQTKSGEILWKISLEEDLGGSIPNWGYSESPLVDGDHVLCTPGGDKGAIAALDKMSGKLIWQTEDFTDTAHYASIIPSKFAAMRHLVQLTQENAVGISPADGTTLWSIPWPGRVAVIPTPVVSEGSVFVTSGYGSGCKLIRLASAGDKIEATEAYESKLMKNHHGGVVLADGHIYGYSDGVGWLCMELETGKEVWSEKEKLGKGAITYADGHLYCLSEETGEVVLIAASTEGWNEKGRFTLTPQTTHRKSDGGIWTHPVISHGRLYLRDQEFVYCFDISQK
jgi:outer membrane protein assembly factor BamB